MCNTLPNKSVMKKKATNKQLNTYRQIRKPIAKPTVAFANKVKFSRKEKHKKKY